MTRTLSRVLAGAALLLLTVGQGGIALAHANYVRSTPSADARLAKAPAEIRIAFSETPDPRGSDIALLDTAGKRLDLGDVRPSDEPNGLRVSVGPIGEGGYLVSWTALSTVDGHKTKGTFAFAVGSAPLPALPDVPDAVPAPSMLEIAGRALSFAGVALVVGIVVFGIVVLELRGEERERRESVVLLAGGALLVAGAAALVIDQGARLPARLALLLAARAAAGVVVALAQTAVAKAFLPTDARRLIGYAAGLAAALTLTFVSHAAASGTAKALLLDLVHVLAISAWLGGLVALLAIVLPTSPVRGENDARRLGDVIWRFSLLALASVATLIVSGSLQSLDRLVLLEDLWETPYGLALLAKIVLLGPVLAIASGNLLVWGPRLRRGASSPAGPRSLLRGTAVETALLAVVLVAAGFLTSFAPPAVAASSGYDSTRHAGDLRLELLVPSTVPGRNRFVLRVHKGLTPVTAAEKVALRFTMVEHDMGESELVATERAAGEYVAEGSPTAMYGTWRVEAIVRRTGLQDVRTVFEVPIAPPAGQVQTARVIPLGSYNLVTFLDPALPSAGAPITLSIVLIDSTGAAVQGRTLTVTLQGPAAAPALTARETSPGRYDFAIAGLDAGTWQALIALGGDGSATYGFEVRN